MSIYKNKTIIKKSYVLEYSTELWSDYNKHDIYYIILLKFRRMGFNCGIRIIVNFELVALMQYIMPWWIEIMGFLVFHWFLYLRSMDNLGWIYWFQLSSFAMEKTAWYPASEHVFVQMVPALLPVVSSS